MKKKYFAYFLLMLLFFLVLPECGKEEKIKNNQPIVIKDAVIFPPHGSLFGNYHVTITSDTIGKIKVEKVYIGKNEMYLFTQKGNTITGYTQGSPEEGKVDIKIIGDGKTYTIPEAFSFDKLKYPLFKRMVAVGASYTQGWINMGLTRDFQLHSPFAYVAREAGAYYPNGLVKPGVLNGITPETYLNSCTVTSWITPIAGKILETMKLTQEEGKNKFFLANYRFDPDIIPHNLGIGGATISDTIEGAGRGRMGILTVFEHLSYDPYVDLLESLTDPPSGGPFETAMKLHPTILFSTDLFADDILYFAPMSVTPTTSHITSVREIKAELNKMFKKLQEEHTVAFIANLPRITVMPIFRLFKNFYIALGYSQQRVDQWEENVAKIAAEYSEAFTEVASRYPNVHIVDFRGMIDKIMDPDHTHNFAAGIKLGKGGVTINGKFFSIDFLGGLVSLDAIHLTYTGYALLANMFIEKVNKDLGYDIPYVDMEKVIQEDPLTPDKLQKMGIKIEQCRNEFFKVK